MHVLQYTKANPPTGATELFAGNRGLLRIAGPAAAVVALVAFSAFAHHVAPRDEADWLSRLAASGDNGAQLELGLAYRAGRDGLSSDPQAALYWLEQAARGGNAYAADLVGNAYSNGDGTAPDAQQAHHWWQVAADGGNADAQRQLGEHTNATWQQVERVLTGEAIRDQSGNALQARARAHDPVAEFQLAERYRDGAWSVNRDPVRAQQWMQRAATDGNPLARDALSTAAP